MTPRKSPAAPWKSFTQTQQSEAQLNVVVKDGEEIGTTILYSPKTPIEIRRQTKKRPLFRATHTIGTGNCRREEIEGDAYQITKGKRCHWNVECTHFESMWKTKGTDVRAGQVQMGHHQTVRHTLRSVARLPQKKHTASGSAATAKNNNMVWHSS